MGVHKQIPCFNWGGFLKILFQVKDFTPVLWICQKDGGKIPVQEILKDQQCFSRLDLGCSLIPKPSPTVAELKLLSRAP